MSGTDIILLAGGASRRMQGADKVLQTVRGVPLLTDRARTCLNTQARRVIVVIARGATDRRAALDGLNVDIIENDSSVLGMSHSLQVGLAALTSDNALIMLSDLPDLTSADLDKVLDAARTHPDALILRGACENGRPGHPVIIRRALFDAVFNLRGDSGAGPVLKSHKDRTILVPLPGNHALNDLDTPEDWASWNAGQQ